MVKKKKANKSKPKLSKAAFLARMAAGRAAAALKRGKKNPAKFDRCVKAVKKRGGKVNAYAVCAPTRTNAPKLKRLPKKAIDRYYKAAERGDTKTMERIAKSAERKPKTKKRGNPVEDAAERYRFFHGKDPDEVIDVVETIHEHGTLSGIGKLASMKIIAVDGSGIVKLGGFKGALLAQDEKGTQLYIKGGDQSVNLKDFGIKTPHENEILGPLKEVAYLTEKTHLRPEDGGKAEYVHVFGKNKSRLPIVVYDVRNKLLHIAGGGYDLPEVGIRG
jgi:hypothetical protein